MLHATCLAAAQLHCKLWDKLQEKLANVTGPLSPSKANSTSFNISIRGGEGGDSQ